jgi:4-hydroxy-tetrahydrodipicolinate reductase
MVDVAITGATGRMGGTIARTADDRGDRVVAAVHRGGGGGTVCGVEVEPASELRSLLSSREPDVLIDFTGPESTVEYVDAAAATGVPTVVGTTGFDADQVEHLREAANRIPILRAANFSRGIQVLRSALSAAVSGLPGYDIEVTETHHAGKVDAPSGTARTLLDDIEAVRDGDHERVYGREGEAPRSPGDIGVHSRRAGNATGEHEVLLAGNHEELRLVHRAEDRSVFAAGALDAATWLVDREPGWYDFSDVIAERAA